MKIKSVQVDWMERWANFPRFVIEADADFDNDALRYEERNGVYRAVQGDFAAIFYYTRPGEGYGGRTFTVTMTDGTTRDLIGPWSSNSMAANAQWPDDPIAECVLNDGCSAHVRVVPLIHWLKSHPNTRRIGIAVHNWDGPHYQATLDGKVKDETFQPPYTHLI